MPACDDCLRRTWLIERVSGYLEFQRNRIDDILSLRGPAADRVMAGEVRAQTAPSNSSIGDYRAVRRRPCGGCAGAGRGRRARAALHLRARVSRAAAASVRAACGAARRRGHEPLPRAGGGRPGGDRRDPAPNDLRHRRGRTARTGRQRQRPLRGQRHGGGSRRRGASRRAGRGRDERSPCFRAAPPRSTRRPTGSSTTRSCATAWR